MGAAREARERKRRSTARKVAWLSDLYRGGAVHHTAAEAGTTSSATTSCCAGCALLYEQLAALRQVVEQMQHKGFTFVDDNGAAAAAQAQASGFEVNAEGQLLATEGACGTTPSPQGSDQPRAPLATGTGHASAVGMAVDSSGPFAAVEQPSIAELKALYKVRFGEAPDSDDSDQEKHDKEGGNGDGHSGVAPFVPLAPLLQPGLCPPDQGSVLHHRHDDEHLRGAGRGGVQQAEAPSNSAERIGKLQRLLKAVQTDIAIWEDIDDPNPAQHSKIQALLHKEDLINERIASIGNLA